MHWCLKYCTVSLVDDTKICNLSNIWRIYTCLQILTSFYKNKPTLKNDLKNYLFFEEEEEPVAHGVEAHEYS